MSRYAIGLDFGTNSCRSLLVDVTSGQRNWPATSSRTLRETMASSWMLRIPTWRGRIPADYLLGIEATIKGAIQKAKEADPDFSPADVIGIGVDTTGSSPMPVDAQGQALCFQERFRNNPAAMVWLWKDHTSYKEAAQITQLASEIRPQYLSKIGGTYSSEWWWSKILHCRNVAKDVFDAAASWVEICDWIPAVLTGELSPQKLKRSICAAGHKAMFNPAWQGLPDSEFLDRLSPGLGSLRARLYDTAYTADHRAGTLSPEWAQQARTLSFRRHRRGRIRCAYGRRRRRNFPGNAGENHRDQHVRHHDPPATMSRCRISPASAASWTDPSWTATTASRQDSPAVGDIFLWFVNTLVPERYGKTQDEQFANLEKAAAALKPGESGLLALDWNNGNRTILVDVRLIGTADRPDAAHAAARDLSRAAGSDRIRRAGHHRSHRGVRRADQRSGQLRRACRRRMR